MNELTPRQIVRQLVKVHTAYVRKKVKEQKGVLADLRDLRDKRYKRYVAQAERERAGGMKTPPPEPLSVLGSAGPDTNIPLKRKDMCQLYDVAQTIVVNITDRDTPWIIRSR